MKTHQTTKVSSRKKIAAARANGKLGGRPKKGARTPILFLGHFSFEASHVTGSGETVVEDAFFTVVVPAANIHSAVQRFRTFLLLQRQEHQILDEASDVYLESVSEFLAVPDQGIIPYYRIAHRDQAHGPEPTSYSAITIGGVPASADVRHYEYGELKRRQPAPFVTFPPKGQA